MKVTNIIFTDNQYVKQVTIKKTFVIHGDTGSDNYPDDMLLIKASLHVPTDGDGSRQRYIK